MKSFAILIAFLLMNTSSGHHEIRNDVNASHLIHFGGIITGLEWAEPHVLIRIVGNPYRSNSPQWLVEVDSATELTASEIDMYDFEILSHISIIGYPSKTKSRSGESYIYGLYLASTPNQKVLLNVNLINLLPSIDGLKAIPTDKGARFDATSNTTYLIENQ